MKIVHAAIPLAVTLFPAAAMSQECANGFDRINAQIEGAALQAKYKGREGDHPLVLRIKGGELVDLTGVIITATPYESWTGDKPVVDKVGAYLVESKPLIEAGEEEKCMALLEKAHAEIDNFSSDAAIDSPSTGTTDNN